MLSDTLPTKQQIEHRYTNLALTPLIKKIRSEYRKAVKGMEVPKDEEYYTAEYFLHHGTMRGYRKFKVYDNDQGK